MSTCDCDTDHCEHWQARELRFQARTEKLTALPPVKYCVGCFQRLSDCAQDCPTRRGYA